MNRLATITLLAIGVCAAPMTGWAQAPENSLVVNEVGRVGIGNDAPGATLEIVANSNTIGPGNAVGLFRNPGNVAFQLDDTNTAGFWNFAVPGGEAEFRISRSGTGGSELILTSAGNLTIRGQITTAGSCSAGCDRVFHSDFDLESIEEHARQMWQNSHLPAVGPTPENGSFNLTQKTGGMLNELEKAHIYIEQLHSRLKEKEAQMEQVLARLDELEAANKRQP